MSRRNVITLVVPLMFACVEHAIGHILASRVASSQWRTLPCMLTEGADESSDTVGWLRAKLQAAVSQENYAEAAKIKSRIDELTGGTMAARAPSPGSSIPRAMSPSGARDPLSFSSAAGLAEDGAAVAAALEADGVVRIQGVLPLNQASEVRDWIDTSLESALSDTSGHDEFGEEWCARFGNVLSRPNRHDLMLELDAPPVRVALSQLLSALHPVITRRLGADAELYELAALISLPGSARQPVHPDTPIVPGKGTDEGATILTAFCAVQDIDETMGPTIFLPGTHNAEAHASFFTYENFDLAFDASCDDDDDGGGSDGDRNEDERAARVAAADKQLEKWRTWRGELRAGDVSLFDSRCLHAGGANTSDRRRILFYCSFIKAAHASSCKGTLLESLRGRYDLGSLIRQITVHS